MALDKFPVEVPLGGAVNEGDVPVVVQPPRIREAKDCASIKGGAYRKKDGETPAVPILTSTVQIEHTRDVTTAFRPTQITTYPDDGSVESDSYPSPVTGRELTGYYPTEADRVKEFGDHATLELPTGAQRTMAAWNVDPRGDYRMFQDISGAASYTPALYKGDPDESSVAYEVDGASYALFDDDVQKGPERSFERVTAAEAALLAPVNLVEDAPMGFPRVRADQAAQLFWTSCAIPYWLDGDSANNGWGFTMADRPAPAAGTVYSEAVRDVLNGRANISNDGGSLTVVPGAKLAVYDAEGTLLATRVLDSNNDPLTPVLDMVWVDGQGLYTLHVDAGYTTTTVRHWVWNAGTQEIDPAPAPLKDLPWNPIAPNRSWPAGLHDSQRNADGFLFVVYATTQITRLWYDLSLASTLLPGNGFSSEIGVSPFPIPGPFCYGGAPSPAWAASPGGFPRQSRNWPTTAAEYSPTDAMTRGAWSGSFLVPVSDDPDSDLWVGVQFIAGADGLAPQPSASGLLLSSDIYSGYVIHALVDFNGAIAGLEDTVSSIPGTVIASQGCLIDGIGPSVCLSASAPGDNRTMLAQRCAVGFTDIPTSTFVLATRRVIPELEEDQNQALSVCQLQPQSQSLGAYINNLFQLRPNLFVRSDGAVSMMCFERGGPLSFPTDELPGLFDSANNASGASSRSRPYIARLAVESTMGTATSGDYALADGAQMVSAGGPQAPAAGWGPQAILDLPFSYSSTIGDGPTMPLPAGVTHSGVNPGGADVRGNFFDCAGHIVTYDESGGARRTVPWAATGVLSLSYPDDAGGGTVSTEALRNLRVMAYPVPYVLLGLSNSRTALIEVYGSGPDGSTPPQQVGLLRMRPTGTEVWRSEIVNVPAALQPGALNTTPGSQEILYTASGELAADAPDPSTALAAGNNRVWSVSSINRRQAQYTKFLRRGYAPEWNGNLTVRVPGTAEELTAVGVLPDGRVLLFTAHSIYYTYGEGPSDTGQGAGFSEPALLTDTVGCADKRSIVYGEFGCMFQGDRGFYLVDRGLNLTYVGLPYEDTTIGAVFATAIDGLRSEVIFYSGTIAAGTQQRWVYNYLRNQWSSFGNRFFARSATQKDGRPWLAQGTLTGLGLTAPSETPAAIEVVPFESDAMSLTTGWLAMGRIQGFGRVWELQIEGDQDLTSQSALRVELRYDYQEAVSETFTYDTPSTAGRIKIRLRPARQKCEAISVRFSEYAPPAALPDDCTGWRLEMLTLLCGVKAGLDKIPTTEPTT